MRVAIVFPGQGTQTPGMGAPWQDHPAWKLVEQAEAALGEPLAPLVLDAPAEQLAPHSRRAARGAVHVARRVGSSCGRSLDDVVAFAGHSLGQVTALDRVGRAGSRRRRAVRRAPRRAHASARPTTHPGRMAALLGATVEQAADACAAAPDACWIANDNAPGQVVIAGTPEGLDAAVARAKEIGVRRATTLNVGGAFHTPLMASAADGIVAALRDVAFAAPIAPVVANARRRRLRTTPTAGATRSAEHVTVPVRWRTSHGDARRARRRRLRRGRRRLDDRRRRQAHRARHSGSLLRLPVRPRNPCGGPRIVIVPPKRLTTPVVRLSPARPVAVPERMIVAPGVGVFRPARRRRRREPSRPATTSASSKDRARADPVTQPVRRHAHGHARAPGRTAARRPADRLDARRVTGLPVCDRRLGHCGSRRTALSNADLEARGRHQRRVDRRAHGHPRTPHRRARTRPPRRSAIDGGGRRDQARRALARPTSTCSIVATATPDTAHAPHRRVRRRVARAAAAARST